MSSLFSGLNTARSGLMAGQTALDLTSQNISNANTPGYSRQTIDLTSLGANTGSYRMENNLTQVGNGVDYTGITQSRDTFLDVPYRNANSQHSDWQTQSDGMSSIEDVFNEFSSGTKDTASGLSGLMTDLTTSLQKYLSSPTDTTLDATIKSSVSNITFAIRSDYKSVTDFETQEKGDLAQTINGDNSGGGINSVLDNISALNKQIASYEVTGKKANDLRDQRNTLLDTLSGDVDITVSEQKNGMVTVALANDNTHMLIAQDNTVTGLKLNADKNAVEWDDPYSTAATVKGGSVDGYLQVINGDGSNTGTYGGQGIVYFKQKLNDFATNFDKVVNDFAASCQSPIPADSDAAATALVQYTKTVPPAESKAAATITLSDAWTKNTNLFSSDFNNANQSNHISDMISTLSKDGTVKLASGDSFTGSILDLADSFTSDIANTTKHVSNQESATSTIVSSLDTQRQEISSVSIDEEGINIVKYQQSYNASARVITTINDMLNTLINSMGV
jgi:flagellar hook-associated protein 1 FlgK